ncbi:MAG: MFS transporter [Pseudomonadota bacterium]|jgi:MFS family permease
MSRSALSILLFSLLAWTVSNLDQSLFGYAVPGIAAEFGVGLETIGLILSVSFVAAAVLVIFAGLAADRYGRRFTLAAVLAASALFVGLHGYATTPMRLLVLRALAFGLAAGVAPITSVYVAEAAPARHRGLWMGVLQCGYPLGWFLASLLAAPLLLSHGWRSIFLVGFAVVPLALAIAWRLPESDRFARLAAVRARAGGLNFQMLQVLFAKDYRRRSIACMLLFFAFGSAYAGTAFYFPTYFVMVRGYSPSEAAALVGSSNGIAVLGYLLAAVVGEYVWNRRNTYALWCALGAMALLGLMWIPTTHTADLLLFAITGAFFYGSNAVVGALLTDLYPTSIRATAYAVCGSAPLSIGFAFFPAIVPLVVTAVGWQRAFSFAIVPLLLISAVAALWLPNVRSGDDIADT